MTHSLAGRIGASGTPFYVGKNLDFEPRKTANYFLKITTIRTGTALTPAL